jgi:hypothetical protein
MPTKTRTYSKRKPRLPLPTKSRSKSFALKALNNADHRFAVVKELHRRLERLKTEHCIETFSRECLAARAVFLVARLESLEMDAVEGKQISWRDYIAGTKALADVLKRLGLSQERKTAKRLQDYVLENKKSKK